MTLDYFLTSLLRDIDGLTLAYVAQFATIIVFVVQLAKNSKIAPLVKWVNEPGHARLLALFLQVLLWAIVAVSRANNVETGTVFDTLTSLANVFAPVVLGGAISTFAGELGYNFLKNHDTPGFGSSSPNA